MHHCLFKALLKFFYFFLDAALAMKYVLYIITNVFLPFTPIGYRRIPQFAMPVSSFSENYVLILSMIFFYLLANIATFLMPCTLIH